MTASQEPTTCGESASMEIPAQRQFLNEASEPSLDLITREIQNAIQAQQYTEAIARTSTWISKQHTPAPEIVELRALAFEKTANITNELEDALLLTKISPKNANGYLRAAKLYTIQGKQQKAIDVLELGKSACASKFDHALFQQQIDQATDKLGRRVDFIARVPYDILCNILSHLTSSFYTPILCCAVSTVWMYNILRCPVPWRSIEVSEEILGDTNKTFSTGLLPYISQHIQRLKLVFQIDLVAEYLEIISLGDLTNLRVLNIITKIDYTIANIAALRKNVGVPMDSLFSALSTLSQTLTEIKLEKVADISFGRLLVQCPNLTSVCCIANHITGVSSDFPVQRTTSLTNICLRSNYSMITAAEFAPIIQHSPRLQVLQLQELDGNILPILEQYCPELKVIETHGLDRALSSPYYFIYDPDSDGLNSNGLTILNLRSVSSVQPLRDLLEKSGDSLEQLCFHNITSGVNPRTDWDPLCTTSFRRLTCLDLDLRGSPETFCRQVPAMLRCFPALTRLELQNWYYRQMEIEDITPSPNIHLIFDAMADLNHLEILILEAFDIRSQSFTRLLERFTIQQEDRAPLRELDMSFCFGLTVANMYQISRIQSLETLIFDTPEETTVADTTEFMRRASQFPELELLRYRGSEITMEAAQYLVRSCSAEKWLELVTYDVAMSKEVLDLLKEHIILDAHYNG